MDLKSKIQKDVLLSPLTTFKIGGPAKYFVEAESIEEIREFCGWAKDNLPGLPADRQVFVLGGGSNVLISDKGFNGLVIRIKPCLPAGRNQELRIKNNEVVVGAGVPLAKLVAETAKAGLSGLEWAVGIPGTVGGAIAGNAGAFSKSISDSVKEVKVFDTEELKIKNYESEDCDFGYRDSIFSARSGDLLVFSAVLKLKKEKSEIIRQKIKDYVKQRTESFVVGQACAGCFFKNIEWRRKDMGKEKILQKFPELKQFADKPKISVGFLIDYLGLRGKKIGGAMISSQHANFIINSKDATAEHVLMLSGLIKQRVFNHYGFALENEVRLIGFD
ncbi:MAG: UDP-N-acetylenolpyruvoylglucosamine reductase [Candidatus Tagabacteria bacterium CG09_land_8_20_14_0_10_41_14]|uniref:UDP-N-acetylenolpyruvoylglucosamine reductase n=2 Tax=Candidatus Tagaibacteriota TaxID=1817918 RepID=A0A2H0WLC3_9BACT|nr:MAG: UDP-N-acetylenolpyruvoylglucosamine reductase [Candidatus Tagabacteria bacterium CG09_land_8_20_14_0_10_41_14]PJE73089.1 MAG: UDP-N-acetylenolpyruvoylglucosamine reductase [Candidatus Tagabacteria bacterium CG10_big_fil_rev_8_21_14_0_10_40_13]